MEPVPMPSDWVSLGLEDAGKFIDLVTKAVPDEKQRLIHQSLIACRIQARAMYQADKFKLRDLMKKIELVQKALDIAKREGIVTQGILADLQRLLEAVGDV